MIPELTCRVFDKINAEDGIRTHELLRDGTLNPAPLTWLGYLRAIRPIHLHRIKPWRYYEVVKLKYDDIDTERKLIRIRGKVRG